MFISGLKNCHIKGLNSYVLRNRISDSSGMIRVFHCAEDCMSTMIDPSTKDFRIAPHNHRQKIYLTRLSGQICNVSFSVDRRYNTIKQANEHLFQSKLSDGDMAAHFQGMVNLSAAQVQVLTEVPLHLPASEVHTVVASLGSTWLVREGDLAPDQPNFAYTHKNWEPQSEGLYLPMDEHELTCAWLRVGNSTLSALTLAELALNVQVPRA